MPCYEPVPAWWSADKSKLIFNVSSRPNDLRVPCGGCVGCRLDASRDWAVRSVHESQLHEQSAFLTLTYEESKLPAGRTLVKRDFQLFMKRYRKELGVPIKFLMCGEYGEQKRRPHYHALIFGHDFVQTDTKCRVERKNKLGQPLWSSPDLQELWGKGFCLSGAVTFQSAAYVGRYIMKKVKGEKAEEHYWNREPLTGEKLNRVLPEYVQPSTGGRCGKGLGFDWIVRYLDDVYPHDFVVVDGRKYRPPRYYDKYLKEVNPGLLAELKEKRVVKAEQQKADNTWARLEAKEKVKMSKFQQLVRNLE